MQGPAGRHRSATEILRRLIRFDTVNPPGNERPAQDYLAGLLRDGGFEVAEHAADPARPNVVARLRGRADGPVLGFLGHTDTVLADPAAWTHDPWSGDLAGGFVWGRGALDMKGQVAAEVAAAVDLAGGGWRPAWGELKLILVVDEETGGALGAQWLTEQRPEAVACDLLLNEGGGTVLEHAGGRYYGVCCAEKGVFRFRVVTEGTAGHASIPRLGDNALLKMAPVLEALRRQPPYDVTEEPRGFLAALGHPVDGDPAAALAGLAESDPLLALLVEPMLGVSVTPTRIRASDKVNVIPARAELEVDCRVPPGMGQAEVRARVAALVGKGVRVEFLETTVGNRSPFDTDLFAAIGAWVAEHDPGARAVPTVLPGFTDSRWFRAAFPGIVAYGFCPQRHQTLYESSPLIHGADERVDERDLHLAADFFADVAREVLG